MTTHCVARASGFEVYTVPEVVKRSSSASLLSGLFIRDKSVTAVIKSLVQYSKTFGLRYNVSFQEALVIDIARDLVSSGDVQDEVESIHCHYV